MTVRLVSNEDTFLVKVIADRDDDLEDMNVLVQAGLDYDVVEDESEDRHSVTLIEDRIQELTNRYYREIEVLQALDERMTVDELASELELGLTESATGSRLSRSSTEYAEMARLSVWQSSSNEDQGGFPAPLWAGLK